MSNGHTFKCLQTRLTWSMKVIAYLVKWPYFCRTCKGWGGHVERWDPSPAGVSLSAGTLEEFEPCQDCADQFKCPRCGERSFFENIDDVEVSIDDFHNAKCHNCGWTVKDGGLIEDPECICGFDHKFLDRTIFDEE